MARPAFWPRARDRRVHDRVVSPSVRRAGAAQSPPPKRLAGGSRRDVSLGRAVRSVCELTDRVGALSVAAALVLAVRVGGWGRAHFLIAAVPWFLVAWISPWHHDGTSRLVSYALAGGLALIVCGVGDHRLL